MSEMDIPESDLPKIMENATRIFSDKNGIINAVKPVCNEGVVTILKNAV